ncbi:ankyrin repeat-containing domain protein [Rhodocollybia butyracea]|uniref:Ankyrin repeat-containing domain protein n=1 Tax=Rhodocollybia butyracea TaxID=206335 RepID=A0A9P5U2E9_9AGAR|nr:ankyrin repeat-containing domain protein [Rhodocollybia butyracea]
MLHLVPDVNEIHKIRDWFKAPNPSSNYIAADALRTPGTGQWILSTAEYQEWMQSHQGQLWIQGKVGSGKSILSAGIICSIKNQPSTDVCYFYFDNRDKAKTGYRGFLLSLVIQIASGSQGVHHHLHNLYQSSREGLLEPTNGDLERLVTELCRKTAPIILVIDAMDECSDNDRASVLDLLQSNAWCFRVIVTSRHQPPYNQVWITLKLDALQRNTSDDIGLYLKQRLQATIQRKASAEIYSRVVQVLMDVNALEKCQTPRQIKQVLERLPSTLEELYLHAMLKEHTEHQADAYRLLQWLICAAEPVSVDQVGEILAIDILEQTFDPEDRPLNIEEGLYGIVSSTLIVIETNGVVQLAHNSVKEFLVAEHLRNQEKALLYINERMAHDSIAQMCIIYLMQFCKFEQEVDLMQYPLALYAAKYWMTHAQQSEAYIENKASTLAQKFFETKNTCYSNWVKIYQVDQPGWDQSGSWGYNVEPIYYAAFGGLLRNVHLLLNKGADVNVQGGEYGNALQVAAEAGHLAIVQLLLDNGADVNAQGGEYGSALQAAADGGHLIVVKQLLDSGADVNALGGEYGSALQAAADGGHLMIVKLLLDSGTDPNAQGGIYGNALQAAAEGGHQAVVKLLLDSGADVNAQGGKHGNALQAAVDEGHRATVKLLLDSGANIAYDSNGEKYGSALQAAADEGNQALVKFLVDSGADVNAQGGEYGNALQAAADGGHLSIVKLLLDSGADVNAQGGEYGSALQAAADGGHIIIVKLLLDRGADVNAQGGKYGNALQAAADGGHKVLVQLLLDSGANVNALGGKYGNALQAAADSGHQTLVQLLLDNGANINAQGGKYENALQAALYQRHKAVVKLLVDSGAEVKTPCLG